MPARGNGRRHGEVQQVQAVVGGVSPRVEHFRPDSFHHSRQVRDYVASLEGKLQLFFLPPYSPELNPDEQVWNYVKHHGVAKAALQGRDGLQKLVIARLRSLQKLPFLAPGTRYAAL